MTIFLKSFGLMFAFMISAQSTLIVTPTRVVPRFDDQPTIGIEGLFQDFQRPPFDSAESQRIQPSSVKR